MAQGLLRGATIYPDIFKGCESTANFCLTVNNLFDILNVNDPEKGLRIGSQH